MKRIQILFILAVMFILIPQFTHAAPEFQIHNLILTDYSIPINGDSHFSGALENADGTYTAIELRETNNITYEDYFPAFGGETITITLDMDSTGYTGLARAYSTEYHAMINLRYTTVDSDHIIGYTNNVNGITTGTLDGTNVQFDGIVHNGETAKIRGANHGKGFLIQDGNLITYQNRYTVNLPIITR